MVGLDFVNSGAQHNESVAFYHKGTTRHDQDY